jgi:hypothetical protein
MASRVVNRLPTNLSCEAYAVSARSTAGARTIAGRFFRYGNSFRLFSHVRRTS